ncbi:fosfomycin resistance glutathione transferase [Franzmannia qiaohouensis]|uniref:Fosfomycin resistance glutathione transferase n=1 Tax=Franzmannia qiaohouensis TaxID=1329370 RepID=A0ABU1HDW8_9GAMM|nr:fosfomycin resistance glutathione transferase [Halomonas qiaohouensis]MDR5905671.1 fosfomycin resistance glutathione transferase [Halomonas qiaohouensis]
MITGINHVTLAVSDLERAFAFYTEVLGLKPIAKWTRGAYLQAGDDWICLSLDAEARSAPHPDYTHLAFSVPSQAFNDTADAIRACNATIWKHNRSEGDSLYFLDPDGHKLEIHSGDLKSRLAALREQPYDGLKWFVQQQKDD